VDCYVWIVNHFVARLLMNFIATKLVNPIMSLDTTRRSNLPDDNFSLPFHERCFCRNSLAQFFVLDTDSDGFFEFPLYSDEVLVKYNPALHVFS
jgi:hypothetical protein